MKIFFVHRFLSLTKIAILFINDLREIRRWFWASTVKVENKSSIEERIKIIELILQSLKSDIKAKPAKTKKGKFKVRQFSLGEEVHVDRDEMYSERGF